MSAKIKTTMCKSKYKLRYSISASDLHHHRPTPTIKQVLSHKNKTDEKSLRNSTHHQLLQKLPRKCLSALRTIFSSWFHLQDMTINCTPIHKLYYKADKVTPDVRTTASPASTSTVSLMPADHQWDFSVCSCPINENWMT